MGFGRLLKGFGFHLQADTVDTVILTISANFGRIISNICPYKEPSRNQQRHFGWYGSIIVLPHEASALQIEEGKDYCTLVTCTPYGVNSHRLLVRGHRIENVEESKVVRVTANAIMIDALLVAPVLAAPVLLLLLLVLLLPRRAHRRRSGRPFDEP